MKAAVSAGALTPRRISASPCSTTPLDAFIVATVIVIVSRAETGTSFGWIATAAHDASTSVTCPALRTDVLDFFPDPGDFAVRTCARDTAR